MKANSKAAFEMPAATHSCLVLDEKANVVMPTLSRFTPSLEAHLGAFSCRVRTPGVLLSTLLVSTGESLRVLLCERKPVGALTLGTAALLESETFRSASLCFWIDARTPSFLSIWGPRRATSSWAFALDRVPFSRPRESG